MQVLLLDSLAPLTAILEAHHKGVTLDHKEVIQAAKSSMHLIGNANAHLLHLRRERIVSDMNKALLPIVGHNNNFKEAAPFLSGTEFAKKSKGMVEQVKAIRSTISKKQERKLETTIFSGWPPHQFGGGFNRRFGRGGAHTFRHRDRPYPVGKGQPQAQKN